MGKGVRGLERWFFHLEKQKNLYFKDKHQEWTSTKRPDEAWRIRTLLDLKIINKKMCPKNVITWILIVTLVSHLTNMRVTVLISLLLPFFCFRIQHLCFLHEPEKKWKVHNIPSLIYKIYALQCDDVIRTCF